MQPSQLEIQRLQRELRGYSVTNARRSIGSCILLNFTTRSKAKNIRTKPGLLVELAKWEIRSRNIRIARSCARPRVIDAALVKLVGARIAGARISDRGIELTFDKPFTLSVSSLTPGELGPGWDRLEQWVLFGARDKVCQPVKGRIARA